MSIKFILDEPMYSAVPEPIPASKCIPDWYKDTPLNEEDEFGESHHNRTVRGCMPFLDAMTIGWVLRIPQDLSIRSSGSELNFEYGDLPGDVEPISPLGNSVLPTAPNSLPSGVLPVKLSTHWYIDGHEGSKAWVMPPQNRFQSTEYEEMIFTSGIYSIDSTYIDSGIIAFLDTTNNLSLDIRAGTPIAQVMLLDDSGIVNEATVERMTDEERDAVDIADAKDAVNLHRYKEELWEPVGRAKTAPKEEGDGCPIGYGDNH